MLDNPQRSASWAAKIQSGPVEPPPLAVAPWPSIKVPEASSTVVRTRSDVTCRTRRSLHIMKTCREQPSFRPGRDIEVHGHSRLAKGHAAQVVVGLDAEVALVLRWSKDFHGRKRV